MRGEPVAAEDIGRIERGLDFANHGKTVERINGGRQFWTMFLENI